MPRSNLLLTLALVLGFTTATQAAQFEVAQNQEGVAVKADGKLFIKYTIKSGPKPIIWPIVGPFGDEVMRQYPMRPAAEGEKADHIHHRSCWFTHGSVNGISFWDEGGKHGDIVHKEFIKVAGGEQAVIVARNDWVGPDGKKQCEDQRTVTVGRDGANLWFDFDIKLTATNGPVTFGDTKEGTFGVRVAGTMSVDSNQGGRIINSNGQTNAQAWAKTAAWCDYYGPVNGKIVGIAILNHPSSFRFPTYWHVRTYGLFSANPFGVSDFTNAKKGAGDYTLEAGKALTLNYRVLIHKGDEKEGRVAQAYEAYAKVPKADK